MAQTIEILQLRHKSFWNHNIMDIHHWTDDLQIGMRIRLEKEFHVNMFIINKAE